MSSDIVRSLAELMWRFAMLERRDEEQGPSRSRAQEQAALAWAIGYLGDEFPVECEAAKRRTAERFARSVRR